MNKNKDFYIVHLDWDCQLIKCAQCKSSFSINKEDSSILTNTHVMNVYSVIYQGKKIFRFSMKTIQDSVETFVKKNKKIYKIIDDNSLDNFITECEKYARKIFVDYQQIEANFYIDDWIDYMNEIPLKKKIWGKNDNDKTKIYINVDGTYILFLNIQDQIEFTNLDQLISSHYLVDLRRTLFYNILKYTRLF